MQDLKKYFFKKIFEKLNKKELSELEKNIFLETKKIKNNLEKKDLEVIVTDLDDTIFSTNERFIYYPELKNLRGDKGNKYIIENIGFENFIKKIYKNKKYPFIITSKLKEKKDLILTAGIEELQKMKLKELGLEKFNYIVVEKAEEKILALIKYIYFDLKYIPKKIIVYEDRPHFFIYFKEFLEKFLKTKLEIIYIKMNGNNKEVFLNKIN